MRRKPQNALRRTKKAKSLSSLIKELDRVLSLYTRKRGADKKGIVTCYTSGRRLHWSQAQCGHYISRGVRATRWDENNVRPQSVGENIFKNGNPITFRENLVKEIGEESVQYLEQRRFSIFKPDRSWIEERIEHYKTLLKELE